MYKCKFCSIYLFWHCLTNMNSYKSIRTIFLRFHYNMPTGHEPSSCLIHILKLVRTLLNNVDLGTSTTAIFLSNDYSLYALILLGWTSCLISFVWDQSTCQESVQNDKIQNEKFLPTVGFEPTTLRFEVWCSTDWASRAWCKPCYLRYFAGEPLYNWKCPIFGLYER